MNYRFIAFILGRACMGLGIIFLLPCAYAYWIGEVAGTAFLFSAAVSFLFAGALTIWGRFSSKWNISLREGMLSVVLAWLVCAILCSIPYYVLDLADFASSFFESMSGLTTTGATVFTHLGSLPKSILLWRSMTNWVGGMGIIVLFVVLLPQVAGGMAHLFNAEVSHFGTDRVMPRIRSASLTIFSIYVAFTLVTGIVFLLCGMNLFDAVNHSLSLMSTGGFSLYPESIGYYDNAHIEIAATILMIVAGGNFALYHEVWKKGITAFMDDTEFKFYILIFLIAAALITLNLVNEHNLTGADAFRYAAFHSAAFISTTGLTVGEHNDWPYFSQFLLFILYFVGGCAGSAAGGVKIGRVVVLARMFASEMRKAIHPQMLTTVLFNKKALSDIEIGKVNRFFFVYIAIFIFMSLLLAASGCGMQVSMTSVAACLSTIGPAVNAEQYDIYANINAFGKIVLSFTMLIGRLELFTVLALLRPEFWSKNRNW